MAMAAPTDSPASTKADLTTCSICFKTFKTPKYFPCLHSFCEGCIKKYILTTYGLTNGGVNCPLCRLFVSKPENVSIGEWSTELPTNHILVSLIYMNESKAGQKLCTACARDNETKGACSWCVNCSESLCKACDRAHRKNRFTSRHKLVGIETSDATDLLLHHADVPCTEHPGKKVEAYCTDHSAVCCMTCVMLKHRKCENVSSIEDASEQKKKSIEVQDFTKDLQKLKKSLGAMVNDRAENLQKFEKDIKNIKTDIDTIFKRISGHLDCLKSDMLSVISQIEKEVRPGIEDKRDEIKCKISAIENDLALFQTNMKYAPPAQFLQAMEKLIEQKRILEEFSIDQDKGTKDVEVTFEANEKFLGIEKDICLLGKIDLRKFRKGDLPQSTDVFVNMNSVVPTLSSMAVIQTLVTGIAVLDTGHIVLSNYSEKTLQLRDQHCSTVLSSISLPGDPWGIKMTNNTEGAVAVYGHGLIIFNIQNNQITKIKEIKINVNHDFVYNKGKYYVGDSQDIIVYDSSLRKIGDISVNNVVYYMALREDNSLCYTSGREVHCITTSMDSIPVFKYSHISLKNPQGITVFRTRFIFVGCHSYKNVHQLSYDGKLQKIIYDLPAGPCCIGFSIRGDRGAIGCYNKIALYNLN